MVRNLTTDRKIDAMIGWQRLPRMNRSAWMLASVFIVSGGGAALAYLDGVRVVGNWLVAPALVLSGWLALGHLITIDDDLPGEWSNPQGSRTHWNRSLWLLAAKLIVFAGLVWWVLAHRRSETFARCERLLSQHWIVWEAMREEEWAEEGQRTDASFSMLVRSREPSDRAGASQLP